jgi:hypothetical protein
VASTTKGQQQQPAPPPASKPAPAAAQKQLSASAQQPVPDRQPPAEKPATAPVNRRDDNEEETIKLEYPSKSILNRSTRPMVAQTNAEVNGTAPPSRNRVIVSNFNFINFFINIINFINIGIKYCRIQSIYITKNPIKQDSEWQLQQRVPFSQEPIQPSRIKVPEFTGEGEIKVEEA